MIIPTIKLRAGGVEIIDQRLLPGEYRCEVLRSVAVLCEAIRTLAIRGAPALGIAGAFGLLLAVEERWGTSGRYFFDMEKEKISTFPKSVGFRELREVLDRAAAEIRSTRPTAVNLFWALDRMQGIYNSEFASARAMLRALYNEASSIYREDLEMCRMIGVNGAALLNDKDSVLTHCNAGGLATSGFGTALGVIFAAAESGKSIHVYADETRPLLQGARLTAWECIQHNIPVTVVAEGMAGHILSRKLVSCVIVGADRIASNGDTANKIGTLNLAIIARRYDIPFYVAAPSSTVDPTLENGKLIPIEERPEEEVKEFAGIAVAPQSAAALNPAFDVTPCELITAIITERGVYYPPFSELASGKQG